MITIFSDRAATDDRKPERRILPLNPLADFQRSFRGTGGTPMILFARPQCHAPRRAQGVIGVPPVFPISRQGATMEASQRLRVLDLLGRTPVTVLVPESQHGCRDSNPPNSKSSERSLIYSC
jgi:hypothetical protein